MKRKKVLRGALAVFLSFLLATQALAAVYHHDIGSGSLNIISGSVNADGYRVTGSTDVYTITVDTDVTTTIELDNVNIDVDDKSGIDIQGNADVTLKLTGENTVRSEYTGGEQDGGMAAVHVDEGKLTVEGDGSLDATAAGEYNAAAGIGTNADENLTGSINITGGTVTGKSEYDGAGIGTGQRVYEGGNLNGEINITGGTVTGIGTSSGAGIGTGYAGYMGIGAAGSINIGGDAIVYGTSENNGAGIGTGSYGQIGNVDEDDTDDGDYSGTGSISIGGNAQVYGESIHGDGAGIGTGYSGDLTENGAINVADDATVVAVGGHYSDPNYDGAVGGAGIGTGAEGMKKGTISVSNTADVTARGYGHAENIGQGTYEIDPDPQVTGDEYYGPNPSSAVKEEPGVKPSFEPIPTPTPDPSETPAPSDDPISGEGDATVASDDGDTYIIWNKEKTIAAIISGWFHGAVPKELSEAEADEATAAALTEGAQEEQILVVTRIWLETSYTGTTRVRFVLGEEYAGKRVELRWLEDGKLVSKSLKVNSKGYVTTGVDALGAFAVVLE